MPGVGLVYKKVYCEAHVIMEAKKFQNLQSANWRPQRVDGVVPHWKTVKTVVFS